MKAKCDHRSKFSNLSNWKVEAWKKQAIFFERNCIVRFGCYVAAYRERFSVNDSSTRHLFFLGENLADGGSLFRSEVCHANFEGTAVLHVYTHLPSFKAFSDFAFTKMQWANVCNEKFARKQIFIPKRLDSMFGRELVPGWRPFVNKLYCLVRPCLWKGKVRN